MILVFGSATALFIFCNVIPIIDNKIYQIKAVSRMRDQPKITIFLVMCVAVDECGTFLNTAPQTFI